jgi:hypothetical protein
MCLIMPAIRQKKMLELSIISVPRTADFSATAHSFAPGA